LVHKVAGYLLSQCSGIFVVVSWVGVCRDFWLLEKSKFRNSFFLAPGYNILGVGGFPGKSFSKAGVLCRF
jgi:hypothetical protein